MKCAKPDGGSGGSKTGESVGGEVRCLRPLRAGMPFSGSSDINSFPLLPYRELPSLAKNWVMRMLFLEQPLPQAAVALWVKKEFSK